MMKENYAITVFIDLFIFIFYFFYKRSSGIKQVCCSVQMTLKTI